MKTSAQTSSKTISASKCPRCGSTKVESRATAYDDVGVMNKTICKTCGFWVCNCAFQVDGEIQYRGFLYEGEIPKDVPLCMRRDALR